MSKESLAVATDQLLINTLRPGLQQTLRLTLSRGESPEAILQFCRRAGAPALLLAAIEAFIEREVSRMRHCPFLGCKRSIATTVFACRRHWSHLNREQKGRIWEAYSQWQRGLIDGAELRAQQQRVLDEVQGVVS